MKTPILITIAIASGLSLAGAAQNSDQPLTERTAETLEHAGDKTVEAGRSLMNGTKKMAASAIDAVTPESDARKVDVKLTDGKIEMPRKLHPGKTGFIVRNFGKEKHSFEVRGEGADKKFMLGLGHDETKVLHMDLKPGTYKAFCPEKGAEHEGMSATLIVH